MALSPQELYLLLLNHFGHQHWWPVDSNYHQKQRSDPRVEIMVGAILTQNTAWGNVEKALQNLKLHKKLTIDSLITIDINALKTMIQPSGFFNQKAHRLKVFASFFHERYNNDLSTFFSGDAQEIRAELLNLKGIGPETADSMLLYAGNHPVFVVDAYTRRICKRLPLPVKNDSYEDIQVFFEHALKKPINEQQLVPVYKELHALLVMLAKRYCKKKPVCECCPLTSLCEKLL